MAPECRCWARSPVDLHPAKLFPKVLIDVGRVVGTLAVSEMAVGEKLRRPGDN